MNEAVLRDRAKLQGRIFRRAVMTGLDAEAFTKAFMTSEQAKWLDFFGDSIECMGEAYILDEILSVCFVSPKKGRDLLLPCGMGRLHLPNVVRQRENIIG